MSLKGRVWRIWEWVGVIWVVGVIIFMVYNFNVNGTQANLVQNQLESEFKSIEPLPESRALDYSATHKASQASVLSEYRTNLPYAKIRTHYDAELTKHNWVFYEEDEMTDWGRNLGGKMARYCKGEYRADLQYAGEQANYGWDYAFSVSWGLDSLVEQYSDKFSKVGCK